MRTGLQACCISMTLRMGTGAHGWPPLLLSASAPAKPACRQWHLPRPGLLHDLEPDLAWPCARMQGGVLCVAGAHKGHGAVRPGAFPVLRGVPGAALCSPARAHRWPRQPHFQRGRLQHCMRQGGASQLRAAAACAGQVGKLMDCDASLCWCNDGDMQRDIIDTCMGAGWCHAACRMRELVTMADWRYLRTPPSGTRTHTAYLRRCRRRRVGWASPEETMRYKDLAARTLCGL